MKTIYQLVLWEVGERYGKLYPDEFAAPAAAEKAAVILLKTGKYNSINIVEENIVSRTEKAEISSSGIFETLFKDLECAEKWENFKRGLFPDYYNRPLPARYINDDEEIRIDKYSNGKYYIHYGWMENQQSGVCVAGGFDTFDDAEKTLVRHRPLAIKTT